MTASKRNEPIIEVKHLSKQYSIGVDRTYKTLSDSLTCAVKDPLKMLRESCKPNNTFWALKDVNFDIKSGEVVGIIGRNGAGKSTLLKVLSHITHPTEGEVRMYGRVGSLLEVGTGFHPELSGRENIYFNGAILGMKKKEIDEKFDEIVKFSGVEKFLDTPVKRYSSGMSIRLAFSVAAHLDPEILVVDEVLAVGDMAFQKKCLGKMEEVAEGGRTVLFVSHNLQAIRHLCNRAILLQSGKVVMDDESSKAIEYYLQDGNIAGDARSIEDIIQNLPSDMAFKLEGIVLTQNGQPIGHVVENGKPLEIEIRYRVLKRTTGLRVYFDLLDDQDLLLFRSFHDENNDGIPKVDPGYYVSKVEIPANILGPVIYTIKFQAGIHNVRSCLPTDGISIPIKVEHTSHYNQAYLSDTFRGKFALVLDWKTEGFD